jgi:AraC family transcriptional regulator of adaptative response / DNA-3-methyladenine glycosylase II
VEQVTQDRYARTVQTTAGPGIIELIPRPGQSHVLLRARLSGLGAVSPVVGRARRLLDADADPAAIGAALATDGLLAPLVRAGPLRVPGAYDGFELAVRGVLGQRGLGRRGCSSSRGAAWPLSTAPRWPPTGPWTAPQAARARVVFPGPDWPRPTWRARAHHRPAAHPARARRSDRQRAADPGSRADPGDLGPAGRAARHRALTIGYILMRAAARPGRLPEADWACAAP